MQAVVTLVFNKGLSENQGRVSGGERQISDKHTAVYHRWPASDETPALSSQKQHFLWNSFMVQKLISYTYSVILVHFILSQWWVCCIHQHSLVGSTALPCYSPTFHFCRWNHTMLLFLWCSHQTQTHQDLKMRISIRYELVIRFLKSCVSQWFWQDFSKIEDLLYIHNNFFTCY